MFGQLGTTWFAALLVVLSTIAIYFAFVLLVRLLGQRSLATVAAFDLAVVVAVGSLIARTSLLREPTLMQGLIALTTLFSLQATVGRLRRLEFVDHVVSRRPVLLVENGVVQHGNLRRAHLLEAEVRQKLRLAGIGSLASVAFATLERNGSVSVIRQGSQVHMDVMIDVPGISLPDSVEASATSTGRCDS